MVEVRVVVDGKSYAGKRVQRALIYSLIKKNGPMRAYDVLKALKEMGLNASPSSVYNALEKMVREGYLLKEGDLYRAGDKEPDPSALEGLRLLEAFAHSPLTELMEALGELLARYAEADAEERRALDGAVVKCLDELKKVLR